MLKTFHIDYEPATMYVLAFNSNVIKNLISRVTFGICYVQGSRNFLFVSM